jgi:hypothetical protein
VQLGVQLKAQPGVQPAVKSIVQPVQPPGANPPEQKKALSEGRPRTTTSPLVSYFLHFFVVIFLVEAWESERESR